MAARGPKGLGAGLAVGRGRGRGPRESRGLKGRGRCGAGASSGRGVVGAGRRGPGRSCPGGLPWRLPEASRGRDGDIVSRSGSAPPELSSVVRGQC